jgi:hypothetical protein
MGRRVDERTTLKPLRSTTSTGAKALAETHKKTQKPVRATPRHAKPNHATNAAEFSRR